MKKSVSRESNIIHREIAGKNIQVPRMRPDKKPTFWSNSLSPKKNVRSIVARPDKAEGSRFANSDSPPKKKINRFINQK